MPISWNEIRANAIAFSREWKDESREHAEAKSFWDDFFKVFGLTRRHVASYEEPVKNLSGNYGFIDLFWKGVLLAEHKSLGKDLDKAHSQAMDYIQSLDREGRQSEVPRYVIVSDFARIALHDLEEGKSRVFLLEELHKHIDHFSFIPGYKKHSLEPEDPINIKAVEIMGNLHDALEEGGYSGHDLERLLVRILFCLFAEDTGIFEREAFTLFIENHTREDGSDLGGQIAQFFQVLNRPVESRQKNLPEELAALPYVNGDLFSEHLNFAAFDRAMRGRLLIAARFDWSRISPAVFGALFQSIMEPKERRQIGAHYTSERDILKLIGPLFLDDLKAELEKAGNDKKKLEKLHQLLAGMRLFDPACGCGNFLVISYRELRLLEIEILRRRFKTERFIDISTVLKLDVDQMYGIEIEEWPARIAEVAMWLMDHQMNQRLSEEFGDYFVRLPLRSSPHIYNGNALTTDWEEVLPAEQCTHLLGNPPFIGYSNQTTEQKQELKAVANIKNSGILDYVTGWYFKAAQYIENHDIPVAFVSTNSISQGQQVGVLWEPLTRNYGLDIFFAHRTFAWDSEARGKAHVHVVIVGFCKRDRQSKMIFDYDDIKGEPLVQRATRINGYLTEADHVYATSRSQPISNVPTIRSGNKPVDGGFYLFTPEEKKEFINNEPESQVFFRRWYGSTEFINSIERWCLWLGECSPDQLRTMPNVLSRVQSVHDFRSQSKKAKTRELANHPTRFEVETFPNGNYLLIPRHSSETRKYIPIGYLPPTAITGDAAIVFPDATPYHFGILSSSMHMAWVRFVAGRIKSDYRYSAKLVYNNYPWPQDPDDKRVKAVEKAAQAVLDARDEYPDASLADLYDPLTMPAPLAKAHATLDRAVERCYRSQPFPDDRRRVEHLFTLYEKLTQPLMQTEKKKRKKK